MMGGARREIYLRAARAREGPVRLDLRPFDLRTVLRPVDFAFALRRVAARAGLFRLAVESSFFARLRARFQSFRATAASFRARLASRFASFKRFRARRSSSFASRTRCWATSACKRTRSIVSAGAASPGNAACSAVGISLPVFFMAGPAKRASRKSHTSRYRLPPHEYD
jgi:hypothetical protein